MPILIKILTGALLTFLAVFIICGLRNPLSVSEITVDSDAIDKPVRIALISDLHSCRYGEEQSGLIDLIEMQEPDLICLVGDIFDDSRPDDDSGMFIARISEKYPCYYVTGNHECRSDTQAFREKMGILEKYGVIRLSGESRLSEVNGQKLCICGVDDPRCDLYDSGYRFSDALHSIQKTFPDDCFSLLLSHRPEYFPLYADCGFDLTLCGHAHGGQWRIPLLLENGLLAPNQGLFPEYTNGKYVSGNSTMIVSRGLARESTRIPRFYNRPEIVIVNLR